MKDIEKASDLWPAANRAFSHRRRTPVVTTEYGNHMQEDVLYAQAVQRHLRGSNQYAPREPQSNDIVSVRNPQLYRPLLEIASRIIGLPDNEDTRDLIKDRYLHELAHGTAVAGRGLIVRYKVQFAETESGIPIFAPSASLAGRFTRKDVYDFMNGPKHKSVIDRIALS